jgi:uncharacterized protein YprB with RNaseH-like and TPR domain
MYWDLKSKLDMYRNGSVKQADSSAREECDINNVLNGSVCSNEDGHYYYIENRYPLNYLYGGYPLAKALQIECRSIGRICGQPGIQLNTADFLFLDTETTGLSGGAGTVAFLIGTGCFEDNAFVLRQYFMRDYDEEAASLRALNQLLSKHKGLVTFNGKAFDWNILQGRYIFNRIKPGMSDPTHMDLLYPSRRIWRLKLESCRLVSLEENILGEYRVDDIPGALIPSVYFKYLEDRNAEDIKRIIRHNELDILSMVSLLIKISSMLENPLAEAECKQELLGLGRIFEKNGEYDNVMECFEECIKSDNFFVKDAACRKLSDMYKRSGNYEKAVEHWINMTNNSETVNIFPMVELAKYYEHKEKNIAKAIDIVEKAIQYSSRIGFCNNIHYDDLKKRLSRLQRKAGRSKNA